MTAGGAVPGSEPLRVLAVMPSLTPEAGAETSLAAVTPWLVEHGVEMHLALFSKVQTLAPQLQALGVTLHDLSGHPGVVARTRALHRLTRSIRPDLVHATLFEAEVPAQLAAAWGRQRNLVTWASTPVAPGENPRIGAVKRFAVRAAGTTLGFVCRTRYHAVTSGVAGVMRREWCVPERRVRVAERGRDATCFAPRPRDEIAAARHELGLLDGQRMLLAVGRQDVTKAHPRLLAAFDEVAETHPDAVLCIAGREGSATPAVRAALAAMRHGDRARVLGHRDDIPLLLQVATAAVCSSVREGAAGALIEAMASGTPIVTTRVQGLEGVLTDDVNAVVVGPDGLAAGMAALLGDPARAARLAAQAHEDFTTRFTIQRSAQALLEVYRWAAT